MTHYEQLGIEFNASIQTIKAAYKKLVLKYHPDKVQQESAMVAEAERMFKLVQAAYEVLSDPKLRAEYDRGLRVERFDSHNEWGVSCASASTSPHGFWNQSSGSERESTAMAHNEWFIECISNRSYHNCG